jgi:hypothetical protein
MKSNRWMDSSFRLAHGLMVLLLCSCVPVFPSFFVLLFNHFREVLVSGFGFRLFSVHRFCTRKYLSHRLL